MKTFQIKQVATGLALAALVGMIAGCASKGNDKGAATSAALQSTADKTTQVSQQVTASLGALNQLTFNPQGDLRDQYGKFTDAVKGLQSASSGLDSQVASMQSKAQAYFNSWSNQLDSIQSPTLRSISESRKAEVSAKLDSLNTNYQGVKSSLGSFTGDLTDIKTYLDTDLTAAGVAKIKDVVAKTKVDAVPVRDSISKLQSDFSSVSAALSPVVSK
ncbi:MAG TPA: DUF2959 family protein [Verrucomicrobiae bacterium]|jgi:hypothetical protein